MTTTMMMMTEDDALYSLRKCFILERYTCTFDVESRSGQNCVEIRASVSGLKSVFLKEMNKMVLDI